MVWRLILVLEEDGVGPPEVNVGRSEIAEALVIASMVAVRTKAATWRSRSPVGSDASSRIRFLSV